MMDNASSELLLAFVTVLPLFLIAVLVDGARFASSASGAPRARSTLKWLWVNIALIGLVEIWGFLALARLMPMQVFVVVGLIGIVIMLTLLTSLAANSNGGRSVSTRRASPSHVVRAKPRSRRPAWARGRRSTTFRQE